MGVEESAVLFVGVPADLVVERREIKVSQTRYNEHTGKPYDVCNTHYEEYVFGTQIDDEDWIENALEPYGLQYFDGDEQFVGIAIRSVDFHSMSPAAITTSEIMTAINALKMILKKHGIDAEPQLRLEMFYN